jgi:uncharacterized protein YabN with tetrapyrrole methylase and pyrophosphatase domain
MSLHTGSLVAVGCGIRAPSQTTYEARFHIERADTVFSLVADRLTEYWLSRLNPEMESLSDLYAEGKPRRETYQGMIDRILGAVRSGSRVCAVSYGHPGVFAYPLHESIKRARAEGYAAEMLPGISAEDCMFADLGIDPSVCRPVDTSTGLVLWQVGVIGESGHKPKFEAWSRRGLTVLMDVLMESYPPDHSVHIYEAARYPISRPIVELVPLERLAIAPVTALSTLYVPPTMKPALDYAMVRRLGINTSVSPAAAASQRAGHLNDP